MGAFDYCSPECRDSDLLKKERDRLKEDLRRLERDLRTHAASDPPISAASAFGTSSTGKERDSKGEECQWICVSTSDRYGFHGRFI